MVSSPLVCDGWRGSGVRLIAALALALPMGACAPWPVAVRDGAEPDERPVSTANPKSTATLPPAAGVLARHRGWQDVEPRPWAAANEAVRQAGGWRAYAREAQSGAPDGGTATAVSPALAASR